MSRPALSAATHALTAEHRRAFHLLADPVHRLGIRLRAKEGFGAETAERLVVARNPIKTVPGLVNELEVRLPHPTVALSSPRLAFRIWHGQRLVGTTTVAYNRQGLWTMEMSDVSSFSTSQERRAELLTWAFVEPKKTLDENELDGTITELAITFIDPFGDMTRAEIARYLSRADDLASYQSIRSLVQIADVPMQRHASGHSVRGLPGRFLRSPMHRNAQRTVVLEIRKPDLREDHRTAPAFTMHMGRQQPDLCSVTVRPTLGQEWIMLSEIWATSVEDLAFVNDLHIEPGERPVDDEACHSHIWRCLSFLRDITLDEQTSKLTG